MNEQKSPQEQYSQYYKRLSETIEFGRDTIDNRLFVLATGGLALSFTVFSYMQTQGYDLNKWCICIIWSLFGLSAIINVFTHIRSVRSNIAMLEEVVDMIKDPQINTFDEEAINASVRKKNRRIIRINRIEFVVVSLDIAFAIIFTLYNLLK